MNIARVRIGRVTMKNGGADVRVLRFDKANEVQVCALEWARRLNRDGNAPSAFVAIAFWPSGDEPWRTPHEISWQTRDADLPLPRLMAVAADQIRAYAPALMAEDRVMRNLGYVRDDDPGGAA